MRRGYTFTVLDLLGRTILPPNPQPDTFLDRTTIGSGTFFVIIGNGEWREVERWWWNEDEIELRERDETEERRDEGRGRGRSRLTTGTEDGGTRTRPRLRCEEGEAKMDAFRLWLLPKLFANRYSLFATYCSLKNYSLFAIRYSLKTNRHSVPLPPMSQKLDEIKAPIAPVMEEFERKFRESMKSPVPLLDRITHCRQAQGKQMRPMFVFLSAGLHGPVGDTTTAPPRSSSCCTAATLVHDDVVDDSNERRGFFSLNALWKNKIAVLVGDYLPEQGPVVVHRQQDFRLLELVSEAVKVMSEGELLQIEKAQAARHHRGHLLRDHPPQDGFAHRRLLRLRASSAGASDETVQQMHRFGELIGIARSGRPLRRSRGVIGKPTGIDIKGKQDDLPLIHALSEGHPGRQRSGSSTSSRTTTRTTRRYAESSASWKLRRHHLCHRRM